MSFWGQGQLLGFGGRSLGLEEKALELFFVTFKFSLAIDSRLKNVIHCVAKQNMSVDQIQPALWLESFMVRVAKVQVARRHLGQAFLQRDRVETVGPTSIY